MGKTTKRANEVKPDPRLDVMECAKAEGALGPVICVLREVGLAVGREGAV